MEDGALLFEIFKITSWGLDSKDNQEKVKELLYLAAQRSKELASRAQQCKKQGERAHILDQELKTLFKKGDQTALKAWFDEQQALPNLSQRIKNHLSITLSKLNKQKDKKKISSTHKTVQYKRPNLANTTPTACATFL